MIKKRNDDKAVAEKKFLTLQDADKDDLESKFSRLSKFSDDIINKKLELFRKKYSF